MLAIVPGESFAATFVVRARPREGRADSTLLVLRHRYVGHGMREDLVLRNFGGKPVSCRLELKVQADLADLFEVKESRVRSHGVHRIEAGGDGLRFQRHWLGDLRGVRVHADGWSAA